MKEQNEDWLLHASPWKEERKKNSENAWLEFVEDEIMNTERHKEEEEWWLIF